MSPSETPDFLAVGHISKDLSQDSFELGGTVTYGALTALKMGMRPAIVTSGGADLDIASTLSGIQVHVVPSPRTTTFINTYDEGQRSQAIKSIAGRITPSDIPPAWLSTPVVLLAPVAGEVSYALARHFTGSMVMASLQGWLRRWDPDGRVAPKHWEGTEVLPYVGAAIVSVGDIADPRLIDLWAGTTPVLIATMGGRGARLHFEGGWHEVAPFQVREVDPTGAGDVFAAAFLATYHQTGQPLESARFASCAASFCVEAEGLAGIPTRAQVEERLRTISK